MDIEKLHQMAIIENKLMKWQLSEISELRKELIKDNYIL